MVGHEMRSLLGSSRAPDISSPFFAAEGVSSGLGPKYVRFFRQPLYLRLWLQTEFKENFLLLRQCRGAPPSGLAFLARERARTSPPGRADLSGDFLVPRGRGRAPGVAPRGRRGSGRYRWFPDPGGNGTGPSPARPVALRRPSDPDRPLARHHPPDPGAESGEAVKRVTPFLPTGGAGRERARAGRHRSQAISCHV